MKKDLTRMSRFCYQCGAEYHINSMVGDMCFGCLDKLLGSPVGTLSGQVHREIKGGGDVPVDQRSAARCINPSSD